MKVSVGFASGSAVGAGVGLGVSAGGGGCALFVSIGPRADNWFFSGIWFGLGFWLCIFMGAVFHAETAIRGERVFFWGFSGSRGGLI